MPVSNQKEVVIMAKAKDKVCCPEIEHHCHKCKGLMMLVLGVLVLLNAYFRWLGWDYFIGAVLVLKGLFMAIKHKCECKR